MKNVMKGGFTHVRHVKDPAFDNGNGEKVKCPFTLVTRLNDDQTVTYKVGFCSRNEKNYVKKKGIESALKSPYEFIVPIEKVSFIGINQAVIFDLIVNHRSIMPNAHYRWTCAYVKMNKNG